MDKNENLKALIKTLSALVCDFIIAPSKYKHDFFIMGKIGATITEDDRYYEKPPEIKAKVIKYLMIDDEFRYKLIEATTGKSFINKRIRYKRAIKTIPKIYERFSDKSFDYIMKMDLKLDRTTNFVNDVTINKERKTTRRNMCNKGIKLLWCIQCGYFIEKKYKYLYK